MHSRYVFLARGTRDLSDVKWEFDTWLGENGDGNVSGRAMFALNDEGDSEVFVDDYKGLDELSKELLERYPSVEMLKRYGWLCTVEESLFSFPEYDDELKEAVETDVLRDLELDRIGAWFIELALDKVRDLYIGLELGDEELLKSSYRRLTLVRYLENFVYYGPHLELPFMDQGSPYHFRCFQLMDSDGEGETVLVADIHT